VTSQLRLMATTDSLTGLVNRRALDAALETELARSARNRTTLALLMIDVDYFKAYNDRYGHQAGDECLRQVAHVLRSVVKRPADIAARYGGEEFVAALPETHEDGAIFIADTFREALMSANLVHEGSPKGVVTASIGVATSLGPEDRVLDIVGRADAALYDAKAAGRNRVTGRKGQAKSSKKPATGKGSAQA
jgi:diguanylate cyclase (GGDEF)-like protein